MVRKPRYTKIMLWLLSIASLLIMGILLYLGITIYHRETRLSKKIDTLFIKKIDILLHRNYILNVKNDDPAKGGSIIATFVDPIPAKLTVRLLDEKKKMLAESLVNTAGKIDPQRANQLKLTISPDFTTHSKLYVQFKSKAILKQLVFQENKEQDLLLHNPHSIEGYISKISVEPGERLTFYVHSPAPSFSVDFMRYGEKREKQFTIPRIEGERQDYAKYADRYGANWKSTFRFTIPENWKTGMYAARLYDQTGKEFYVTFVVRDPHAQAKIAVLSSTNTWSAYNNWAGSSLYRYYIDDDLKPKMTSLLSTARPNPVASPEGSPVHLANAEKLTLAWLEKEKMAYNLITDWDLDQQPDLLNRYSILILNTHGEYWTAPMYDQLERFLQRGGNLLTLSGNAIHWKAVIKGNQLEVRKDNRRHELNGEIGGYWKDLGRSEANVLGVRYTPSGYNTYAPYEVKQADHWIFNGTCLKNGDLIGKTGQAHKGAAGLETDKRELLHTPLNTVLLAKGTNPHGGAEMIYYDHPGGGGIFSVGSIAFSQSLIIDPHLTRIVKNVIEHFLAK
jgi:N,N-dimethylformamidase